MSNKDNSQNSNGEDVQKMKKEIVRKVIVDPDIIAKMKRLASLYSDELPEGAKEIDVISFFLCKSFNLFLKSGEIERKLDEIKGM